MANTPRLKGTSLKKKNKAEQFQSATLPYPSTPVVPVTEILHGKKITDQYRYLEDKDDPAVRRWARAQNAHTEKYLREIPVRKTLSHEFEKLFRVDMTGVPDVRGAQYFFTARKHDEECSVLYIQKGLKGKPRALVNPNKFSRSKRAFLAEWQVSRDGSMLAYGLSESANDKASVHVLNVTTGVKTKDVIPADLYPGSMVWKNDNSGFWYTRRTIDAPPSEIKFHRKVYFHRLGTNYAKDTLIFGKEIKKEDMPSLRASHDERFLLITVHIRSGKDSQSEIYLYDTQNPKNGFVCTTRGVKGEFFGTMHRDMLYVHTNYKAPFWKIMRVPLVDAQKGFRALKPFIPEKRGAAIERIHVISNYLFVTSLENAHSCLRMYTLAGKLRKTIPLPTIGTVGRTSGEREGKEFFFMFDSFLIPPQIYRIDLPSGTCALFKKRNPPVDPTQYVVKQVWCVSKDETKVPMFLVHKKGLKLTGKNPVYLYGYGGFGVSETPSFTSSMVPFLKQGGIYAHVNLRGGGEFGEAWYNAGRREKKQNVFDDFIAAGEWIIKHKYTSSEKLVISGWSNGGLLTGAILTQRPDLFAGAVIGAPVLDMLRYHLFFGGRHWIADYGDPDDPKMFRHMLKYSPYHNVIPGTNYPAALILTGENDDRVHPMHAYKMAGLLQAAQGGTAPILLRVETKAGHGGAAAVKDTILRVIDMWTFVFGITKMR